MLHGWHSLYSSFSGNEQEICCGSIHLSKNPLCYYIAKERVKACLTILDTVYLMDSFVNSLFPENERHAQQKIRKCRPLYSSVILCFCSCRFTVNLNLKNLYWKNIIALSHIRVIFFKNHSWMISHCHPLDGWITHFCFTVNSLSGCFLTLGSVDNDGALCWPSNQCCFLTCPQGGLIW